MQYALQDDIPFWLGVTVITLVSEIESRVLVTWSTDLQ